MPDLQHPLIVFTDVEGTLLDAHTQQWQAASDWLSRFVRLHIPVILCSNKTAAEMLLLQKELGIGSQPLIAESGAVIQLDADWTDDKAWPGRIAGSSHTEISGILTKLRENEGYKFTTFTELSEPVIADLTGMSEEHASLARLHEASETLIWRDSDERMETFSATLDSLGMQFVQGARLWHVVDKRCGKAEAVSWLLNRYQQHDGIPRTVIGLGDGPDDAPLLDTADFAVVVKGLHHVGPCLKDDRPERVYHTQQSGPEGWREGLDYWLSGCGTM